MVVMELNWLHEVHSCTSSIQRSDKKMYVIGEKVDITFYTSNVKIYSFYCVLLAHIEIFVLVVVMRII